MSISINEEIKTVHFWQEESNQIIESFNGWKYYRLFNDADNNSETSEINDLVVHFTILSTCNLTNVLLDYESYPTILNVRIEKNKLQNK